MQHEGQAIGRWSGEGSQRRCCAPLARRRARSASLIAGASLCETLESRLLLAQSASAVAAAAAYVHIKLPTAKAPAAESLGAGSISGQVYKDVNGNAAFDAGDIGFNGVTVYLDTDGTPGFSGGDPTQVTAGAGASAGTYTFASLNDGTYTIGEVTPSGYIRTGSTTNTATISGGNAVTGKHFGNFPYVFTGSNGTDSWTIKMETFGGTKVQIAESLLGVGTTWVILKSSLPSISINANSGDDVVTVDYTNGDPIPGTGINFDGNIATSPQGDRVTVTGSAAADVISVTNYTVAHDVGGIAIQGCEGVAINGGLGNDSITLGSSMAVQVVSDGQGGTDTLTYNGTDNIDNIATMLGGISDGALNQPYSNFESLQVNARNGSDIVVMNNAACSATFDLGEGEDLITVNIATTGVVSIAGGNGNDEVVFLQDVAVPATVTGGAGTDRVTVTGSNGNDAIDISTTAVSPQGGLYTVSINQTEHLKVDAANGHDVINVNSSTSAMSVTIMGGDGDDSLNLASAAMGATTFEGGNGTNTATFNTTAGPDSAVTLSGGTVVMSGRSLGQISVQQLIINTWGGNDVINVNAALNNDAVTINGGDGNDVVTVSSAPVAALCFNGGLNVVDQDTININSAGYTFASDATTGSANLAVNVGANGIANFNATQHLAALTVSGQATLTAGGNKVIVTRALAVTGKLDLKDNDLIVNYSGGSPLGSWNGSAYTGVSGMIQSGFNNTTWDGNGLITSSNPYLVGINAGLACAESADILAISGAQTEMWSGETVDATCVLVKFTYMGDMDLNGELNGDDYFRLDSNILLNGVIFGYTNGDLDLNGELNGDDYFYMDSNYPAQAGIL